MRVQMNLRRRQSSDKHHHRLVQQPVRQVRDSKTPTEGSGKTLARMVMLTPTPALTLTLAQTLNLTLHLNLTLPGRDGAGGMGKPGGRGGEGGRGVQRYKGFTMEIMFGRVCPKHASSERAEEGQEASRETQLPAGALLQRWRRAQKPSTHESTPLQQGSRVRRPLAIL